MRHIIAIVGKSRSGKTTLIERLIPEIKKRGWRVGSIKHAAHGMDIDQQGKDSHRHYRAGADTVVVSSPGEIVMVKRVASDSIESLLPFFSDMDIVLAEGYKRSGQPKIEVFRKHTHRRPLNLKKDRIAMVTDDPVDIPPGIPRFGTRQIEEIADLILRYCLSRHKAPADAIFEQQPVRVEVVK